MHNDQSKYGVGTSSICDSLFASFFPTTLFCGRMEEGEGAWEIGEAVQALGGQNALSNAHDYRKLTYLDRLEICPSPPWPRAPTGATRASMGDQLPPQALSLKLEAPRCTNVSVDVIMPSKPHKCVTTQMCRLIRDRRISKSLILSSCNRSILFLPSLHLGFDNFPFRSRVRNMSPS